MARQQLEHDGHVDGEVEHLGLDGGTEARDGLFVPISNPMDASTSEIWDKRTFPFSPTHQDIQACCC
jgi:hypothetical protein